MHRKLLVHAVLWPMTAKSAVDLVDADGVVRGGFKLTSPMLGSDIARFLPADFELMLESVNVVSMSGKLVHTTRSEFDTVVVTERAVVDVEERMQRLERREQRRERREAKQLEEIKRLRDLERNRNGPELIEEPDSPPPAPPESSEVEQDA